MSTPLEFDGVNRKEVKLATSGGEFTVLAECIGDLAITPEVVMVDGKICGVNGLWCITNVNNGNAALPFATPNYALCYVFASLLHRIDALQLSEEQKEGIRFLAVHEMTRVNDLSMLLTRAMMENMVNIVSAVIKDLEENDKKE